MQGLKTQTPRRVHNISSASTLGVTFETFWDSYNAEMKHPEEISELNGKQWTLQRDRRI